MKLNKSLKTGLSLAVVTGCLSIPAQAAIILYEFNADSAVVTNNELSGDGVTANDAVPSAGSGFSTDRWRRTLSPDAARTLSFTFDFGATPVDLTSLDFTQGIDSNTGSNDTFSVVNLSISSTGTETPSASQSIFNNVQDLGGAGEVFTDESVTLSGLTNLTNVSITFEFEVLYGTLVDGTGGANSNRFAFIDNVQLTGSTAKAIPEPSSFALLGLGGLALVLRRPK